MGKESIVRKTILSESAWKGLCQNGILGHFFNFGKYYLKGNIVNMGIPGKNTKNVAQSKKLEVSISNLSKVMTKYISSDIFTL